MNKLKAVIAIYDKFSFFHHVEDGELGPANNLTMDSIKHVFLRNLKRKSDMLIGWKGIIPSNVLAFDQLSKSIMFYTEPGYRQMFFSKELDVPNAHYKQPFLLWKYEDGKVYVFALKTKPKDEDAILYQAPFMNVSGNGGVCMGNVSFGNEEKYFDDLMEDIVEKFYNSYFTHTNCNKLLHMNYMDFLKKHAFDKDVRFAKLLVETKQKIKDLL